MDIENRAQGAPRGSFAHIPTGFRRMTPGLLKADRAAESFAGLPEGVKTPGGSCRLPRRRRRHGLGICRSILPYRCERDDLTDVYANPPIQPGRFTGSFQ
jgi:hypothetical protein